MSCLDSPVHVMYVPVMRKNATFQVRCTDDELEAWRKLAEGKVLSLSEYVRSLMNAMVAKSNDG